MTPNDGPFINVVVNFHHFVKKIMYFVVVSFLKSPKNQNKLQ